ncbi:MAG: CoA-disulfide reductase [Ruminococcaceae bacterium]|nr:CoA-disulfide reductase [Oscillospiraceae bacterium]
MKVVIVGGVAGGATAAARLRRLDEKAEIIIFERSGYVSYANCGLPYYIGGEIDNKEDLFLQTPEGFRKRFKIDVKTLHEVTKINRDRKTVTVLNKKNGSVFEESYDKLILSPGAKPFMPDFCKGESRNVFTLRTVEDTLKIREYTDNTPIRTAVIIGGGFIGLKMAENLKKRGIDVTVLQKSKHLLNTVDEDMASFVHAKLKAEGIKILFGADVKSIDNGTVITNCAQIYADMILVSVGVTPENTLAKEAGLKLGVKGAICVTDHMQTSDADIYAVGDAVEITNFISKDKAVITLAGPANKQGRIAADNICGSNSTYKGTQGASVIKLFDMTVASTGMTEAQLKTSGISYEKVILSPLSHAGYYPGATVMTLKVIYEKETFRILGAQCVGFEGVEKRIDVIATAIFAGIPADALKELELTYAPPYSSAKDPVNIAGFIIDNVKKGFVKHFYYEDVAELQKRNDVTLLDTRTVQEYMRGHAGGFTNIPLDELRQRLSELDTEKPVYVMCQSGLRSYLATRILMQNGFDAYNFAGGYRLYGSMYYDEAASKRAYDCGMEK